MDLQEWPLGFAGNIYGPDPSYLGDVDYIGQAGRRGRLCAI